jgi:hypothetical protein
VDGLEADAHFPLSKMNGDELTHWVNVFPPLSINIFGILSFSVYCPDFYLCTIFICIVQCLRMDYYWQCTLHAFPYELIDAGCGYCEVIHWRSTYYLRWATLCSRPYLSNCVLQHPTKDQHPTTTALYRFFFGQPLKEYRLEYTVADCDDPRNNLPPSIYLPVIYPSWKYNDGVCPQLIVYRRKINSTKASSIDAQIDLV